MRSALAESELADQAPPSSWGHNSTVHGAGESRVIETSVGPIEYAATGRGPAVLIIHGCPGGYDQGMIAAKLAPSDEFTFISPSRPGYLRTPLEVGTTPEAQADSYAALLDALGISQAAIIGISGGGPSALQFALRHQTRCWGLITVCGIAMRLSGKEIARCRSLMRRIGCSRDLFLQLLRSVMGLMFLEVKYFCLRLFGNWDGSKRARHRRERINFILALVRSFGMISVRKAGLDNDVTQLSTLPDYPLQKITAPTLVLHGSADKLVSFAHARVLARTVPNSTLARVRGGGHLFFATHTQTVVPAIMKFLRRCAGATRGSEAAAWENRWPAQVHGNFSSE